MRDREHKSQKHAKALRARMTDAERILWSRLRRGNVPSMRFRRQHPIGPYIADFASIPGRLIVEIDGATHASEAERAHDRRQDAYLRSHGWRVFRVTNEDVYKNLDAVIEGVWRHIPPPRSPER